MVRYKDVSQFYVFYKTSSEKLLVNSSPVPKRRESRYPPEVPKGEGDKCPDASGRDKTSFET